MGQVIADRVRTARRYVRSVDLSRDHADPSALDGYVLTPSARDALVRIVRGLDPASTQRAFRVTGPYGSGKSSFGLLLTRLFAATDDPDGKVIAQAKKVIGSEVPAYQPLVIVGRRTSITDEILRAVDVLTAPGGANEDATVNASAAALLAARAKGARDIGPVLDLLSELGDRLSERGSGLLLLVDEMGRFIEFAAANPGAEDPAVFQQLAERCGGGRRGLAVVAFLHNRFSDYVAGLGDWMEGEWARSAERYEELVFNEPAEQSLYLLADALEPISKHGAPVLKAAAELFAQATARGVFQSSEGAIRRASATLYPLHPATIAALVAASRRLGQNERSIFSFLQSFEPSGLQRFLADTQYDADSWYLLDRLFDYFASQGDVRFRSPDKERRWHLALDAIALAADIDASALAALKALAILSVLEPLPGLTADVDTIAWTTGVDPEVTAASLETLIGRGLVHRRSGRQDFSLWSSSSVDLEDWLRQAKAAVPAMRRLDEQSMAALSGRPLVAHQHYQNTGNLRVFGVSVGANSQASDVDGSIAIIPLYPDQDEAERLEEVGELSRRAGPLHFYNLRRVLPADLALAHEHALWTWVRENCPELRIDDLARGEVQRRVSVAQTALERLLAPLSRPQGGDNGLWIHAGKLVDIPDHRRLSRALSDACADSFDQAPILKNELVNRSRLSTAIAAARTRLLELMISAADKPNLGLDGAPPEKTIFLSLFQSSDLHREVGGVHGFHGPSADDPMNWRPTWERIAFLLESKGIMRFDELTADLALPPYGLRAGPAMLVLTAFLIAHKREIAIMERGTFQPELTTAHFMRLGKNPANFSLRHVGDAEERQQVLEAIATNLDIWQDARPEASLKPIVQTIFRWFNGLSEYAVATSNISPLARDVRSVLRKAREPVELLFVGLPKACEVLDPSGRVQANLFAEKLALAFQDLSDSEPKLRRQVVGATLDAFAARSIAELRSQIQLDYGRHILKLQDYRLRSFVDRAMNEELDEAGWIDSIASLLAGRRLASWDDQALDRYTFETRELAQRLARWLALARVDAARQSSIAGVHLTTVGGGERTIFVRRDGDAPGRTAILEQMRDILADRDDADVILAELFAELPVVEEKKEVTE